MITLVIFSLLGIYAGYRLCKIDNDLYYECMDKSDYLVYSMLGFMVGLLLGCLTAFLIGCDYYENKTIYKIESISDNSSLSGKFMLGSGNLESDMSYCFYINHSGYYTLKQIPSYRAVIKITEKNPTMEQYDKKVKRSLRSYFGMSTRMHPRYILKIPKGSIITKYSLDAK